jgi:hypothetical protein
MSQEQYNSRATVVCPRCKEQYKVIEVPFVDISSDIQGFDVLTFLCPNCEVAVEALVRG